MFKGMYNIGNINNTYNIAGNPHTPARQTTAVIFQINNAKPVVSCHSRPSCHFL